MHERGELNDNLLPVGKDTVANMLLDEDPDEWVPHMPYKVGSAKRKQLYDKRVSARFATLGDGDLNDCEDRESLA